MSDEMMVSPAAARRKRERRERAHTQAMLLFRRGTGPDPGPPPGDPGYIDPEAHPQAHPPQAHPQAQPPQAQPPQAQPPQAHPPQAQPPQAYPPQAQPARAGFVAPGGRLQNRGVAQSPGQGAPAQNPPPSSDPSAPGGNPALAGGLISHPNAAPRAQPNTSNQPIHQAQAQAPAYQQPQAQHQPQAHHDPRRSMTPVQQRMAETVPRPVGHIVPPHQRGITNMTNQPRTPKLEQGRPPPQAPSAIAVGGLGPGGGSPLHTGHQLSPTPSPPAAVPTQDSSSGVMGGSEQFRGQQAQAQQQPQQVPPQQQPQQVPPQQPQQVPPQPQPQPQEATPVAAPGNGLMRVSIIGPHFMYGEFEAFLRNLMAYTDRTKIKWEAICPMSPEFYVHHAEAQDAGVEPMGGLPGAQLAGERCDLAIVWGGAPAPHRDGETRVLVLSADMIEATVDPATLVPSRSREEMREEMRLRPEQRAVAFMGDHVTKNNPWALVQALKVLNEGDPDAAEYVGVFVGEGNDLPELRQYCGPLLGFEDQLVRFLGGRTDTGNILAAVDVVLAPAVVDSPGQSVLDAMAAGVPVVATPVGVAGTAEAKDVVLLVPRALEAPKGAIPPMQLEQSELAEKIGTSYAEAISEVFSDREGTGARVERGRQVATERYRTKVFAKHWTAELLRRGDWS